MTKIIKKKEIDLFDLSFIVGQITFYANNVEGKQARETLKEIAATLKKYIKQELYKK